MTVTAVQEAKPDRRADVTAQVAQAAGVPAQTLPDPHLAEALQKWATSIGDMAVRVRRVAPADGVQHILDTYDWRNSIDAARICYDELKALGKEHAPQPTTTEAPAPAAPVETAPAPQAEMLLSDGQRQGLWPRQARRSRHQRSPRHPLGLPAQCWTSRRNTRPD
ncbi:hypothetical protein ACFSC4_31635 [Deinococcus malanensis]|uniref:hypothetical protein n=1 Tax=Deinococcus malanensis TaxID=1706855 RepID=UPI00363FBAFF